MRRNIKCELCGKMKNKFICIDCTEREGLEWVEKTKRDVKEAELRGSLSTKKEVLKMLHNAEDFYNEFILNRNCEKDSKLFIELFKKYFQENKFEESYADCGNKQIQTGSPDNKEKEMLDDEIKFLREESNREIHKVGHPSDAIIKRIIEQEDKISNLKERRKELNGNN